MDDFRRPDPEQPVGAADEAAAEPAEAEPAEAEADPPAEAAAGVPAEAAAEDGAGAAAGVPAVASGDGPVDAAADEPAEAAADDGAGAAAGAPAVASGDGPVDAAADEMPGATAGAPAAPPAEAPVGEADAPPGTPAGAPALPAAEAAGGRLARGRTRLVGLAAAARAWLPLMLLIGAAPGLFVWPLLHRADIDYIVKNDLERGQRIGSLLAVAGSMAVLGTIYAAVGLWRRRRAGPGGFVAAARALNRRLLVLLVLPFVPPLLVDDIETDLPWLVMGIAVGIAAIAGAWTYFNVPAAGGRPPGRWRARLGRVAPPLLTVALAIAYAAVFSHLAVMQHHGLATRIFDLGIYDNIFWHSSHGNPLGTTLVKGGTHTTAHVDPLLVLLSPLYLLAPRAETILILQSVWLSLGVFPLYLLTRRTLGSRWAGLTMAAIYTLYPALHGANLYDFHSLTLVVPLVMWALYFLETGATKRYFAVLALMLLTREDISLLSCFLGLYAVVGRRAVGVGAATIGISLAYLAFVKVFVMPDPRLFMASSEAYGYAFYYKDMIPQRSEGALGILVSAITNPFFTLRHVLREEKVIFLLKLFLPLLFLPFFARRARLMLVYGLAFLLLASREAVYSTHFQYTSVLFPIALCLVPLALARLDGSRLVSALGLEAWRLRPALLLGCLAATLPLSFKYGALLPNDAFRGGFHRLVRSLDDKERARHEWVREAVAQIPPDASVSATDMLGPHVSNREKIAMFPSGHGFDYLFVDERSARRSHARYYRLLKRSKAYEEVTRHGGLVLLKRRHDVKLPDRPPKARKRRRRSKRKRRRGRAPRRVLPRNPLLGR